MMNETPDKFDSLLKERQFVPPSADLADRIIAAAGTVRTVKAQQVSWRELLWELLMPRPALALACSLLLGVLAGLQLPDVDGDDAMTIADDFINVQDDVL